MDVDSLSLAYCYGCRNAGDFSINQGTLSLLERTVPDVEVTAISRFRDGTDELRDIADELSTPMPGFELVGGPISYDPKAQSRLEQVRSLARDGAEYAFDLLSVAPESRYHSELYRRITGSDALLFNGGNAIHYPPSHRSLPYLLAVLYPLHVARRNDVPYAILPQTIFGLEGIGGRLVVPLLDDAEFVMTRDAVTTRYLSSFDLDTRVVDAVDTAFLCGVPETDAEPTTGAKRIAAVPRFSTLGDTGRLDEEGRRMEETFFDYLESLVAAGHEVTLTIQTRMDRIWAARNEGRLNDAGVSYFRDFDPEALRAHYAEMDLLVTMRLHAGIFALSVGTPAVGVYRPEWGPKIEGTWETLGIDHLALTWEEATPARLETVTDDALGELDALSRRVATGVTERTERMVTEFEAALDGTDRSRPDDAAAPSAST